MGDVQIQPVTISSLCGILVRGPSIQFDFGVGGWSAQSWSGGEIMSRCRFEHRHRETTLPVVLCKMYRNQARQGMKESRVRIPGPGLTRQPHFTSPRPTPHFRPSPLYLHLESTLLGRFRSTQHITCRYTRVICDGPTTINDKSITMDALYPRPHTFRNRDRLVVGGSGGWGEYVFR